MKEGFEFVARIRTPFWMAGNLRGGKGITRSRLSLNGHVTSIAYYSIAGRQPVVCCNWRRAN